MDKLISGLAGIGVGILVATFIWIPLSMRKWDKRSYKQSMIVLFGRSKR